MAMGEVIEGIGAEQQKRIDALRKAGGFFWIDVSLSQTSSEAVGKAPPASRYSADMSKHAFLGSHERIKQVQKDYAEKL